MALDAERLRANQTDLLAGEPAIRDEMARLEAVRDVCRGVGGRTKAVVEQAERNVADLKRRGDPSVDELVCSTTIVHDQLSNLLIFTSCSACACWPHRIAVCNWQRACALGRRVWIAVVNSRYFGA